LSRISVYRLVFERPVIALTSGRRKNVTSSKFFLENGGYQKREYWKVDFQTGGKHLSWNEAMALFRDAAGRPGPKNWIEGRYPRRQHEFPVTGISWYEAAAYAEFAGKSLPTIYHWNRAASTQSVVRPLRS
jgi:formylglycine-generating enzyme required for sulfatase activity